MKNRQLGYSTIRRGDLPEMMQGTKPQSVCTGEEAVSHLKSTSDDAMLALWDTQENRQYTFLPNVLVGNASVLLDTIAWSRSFLRDVGPLSGLVRIMTSDEFSAHVRYDGLSESIHGDVLSRCIGIIAGEALVRFGSDATEGNITLGAAQNTLAYCIIRAFVCAPFIDTDEIVRRWNLVRPEFRSEPQSRISELVGELCTDLLRRPSLYNQYEAASLFDAERFSIFGENGVSIRHSLPLSVSNLFPDSFWLHDGKINGEEAVRLFDRVLPDIIAMPHVSPSDRSRLIARIANLATSTFDNQIELARVAMPSLPEIPVWLGYAYSSGPLGRTLAINSGIGWKIANRLSARNDIFSLPNCDTGWLELSIMEGLEKQNRKHSKSLGRQTVEIVPGVYTTSAGADVARSREARTTNNRSSRRTGYKSPSRANYIDSLQNSLEEAIMSLRLLRLDD